MKLLSLLTREQPNMNPVFVAHGNIGVDQRLANSRISILDRVEILEKLHGDETCFRKGVLL